MNPNWPPDLFEVMFIPLSRGKFAVIDQADYPLISNYSWSAQKCKPDGQKCYAAAYVRGSRTRLGQKRTTMHRLIAGAKGAEQVDHRDNDGLNNVRRNLRKCTVAQNHANRHDCRPQSGFKGVWKSRQKFRAAIKVDGKTRYLGLFTDPESAARAYDAAAKAIHGEFAHVNQLDREVQHA